MLCRTSLYVMADCDVLIDLQGDAMSPQKGATALVAAFTYIASGHCRRPIRNTGWCSETTGLGGKMVVIFAALCYSISIDSHY